MSSAKPPRKERFLSVAREGLCGHSAAAAAAAAFSTGEEKATSTSLSTSVTPEHTKASRPANQQVTVNKKKPRPTTMPSINEHKSTSATELLNS